MNTHYFVEILSAVGGVHARHKFAELPIRLGRGYQNDIILDDPHTAAEHAVIELNEQQQLVLRDLGSQNGIHLHGKRQPQFIAGGDQVFVLGQTHIRIRDSHYQVPAEVTDETNYRWEGWPLIAVAITLITILGLSGKWIGDISDSKSTEYIMAAASWLGLSAVWAGLWALANRVFGGSTHFGRHLFTLSCGLLALDLSDYLCMLFGFAFSWEFLTRYSSHLQIAIAAVLIYYHLRHITPRKTARLKMICAGLFVLGSSMTLINNVQSTNMYGDELYMHEVLPPSFRISKDHTLEEFDHSVHQLQKEIDSEREKALKEKQQKNR